MEAVVINARRIRKGFVNGWVTLMVDEMKRSLIHHASHTFRKDPGFLVLCRNHHLTCETIEIPALALFRGREATQAVAV